MNRKHGLTGNARAQGGAVLYLVALMMAIFLGIAALAIDLGIWFVAPSEAQRAAEAGAHAGAGYLMLAPTDGPGARLEAEIFAEANTVRWVTPDVFPDQDIDVILDSQKVRVRVQRSDCAGQPLEYRVREGDGNQSSGYRRSRRRLIVAGHCG